MTGVPHAMASPTTVGNPSLRGNQDEAFRRVVERGKTHRIFDSGRRIESARPRRRSACARNRSPSSPSPAIRSSTCGHCAAHFAKLSMRTEMRLTLSVETTDEQGHSGATHRDPRPGRRRRVPWAGRRPCRSGSAAPPFARVAH
jgi:hypothetical protein